MSDLITPGEAAKLLGVSRETVRRYVDLGLVAGHRTPGGQRRIERSSVEQAIASRRPVAPNVTIIGAR